MPKKDEKLRAALYVRLSREDRGKSHEEDDSESIINQQILLLEYCKKNGIEVYRIFNDEDYRGSDRTRPAFNEMISDARDHRFNLILCKTQSRFARDVELVEKYINTLFPLWGIRFIGVVDNADSANKSNRKARQINSLVDQWMLEDLSDNIKATLSAKRKQGLWVGAFAPFGYIKDPKDKNHLIIDEDAARIVRYVFDLYLKGLGITSIARRLNREGIPNPATYKKQHGQPFESIHRECSDLWHDYTISRMLSNRVYIGSTVQGMSENISYKSNQKRKKAKSEWDIVENTHEAIIRKEIWDKVQQIRAEKPKQSGKGEAHFFAGKLRCMRCHSAMRTYYHQRSRYFACHTAFLSHERCSGTYISEKVLEREVLKQIRQLYDQLVDDREVSALVDRKSACLRKIQWYEDRIAADRQEVERLQARFAHFYADKVDGVITPEQFQTMNTACREKIAQLSAAIGRHSAEKERWEQLSREDRDKTAIVKRFKNLTELDRLTVVTLIDRIEIGGDRNNRIIHIHWNL